MALAEMTIGVSDKAAATRYFVRAFAARQDMPEKRMETIINSIRRALEDADRRYFADAAAAVKRADSGEAALNVRYPEIMGFAAALQDAAADGWRDAEIGIGRRIVTDGAAWIRAITAGQVPLPVAPVGSGAPSPFRRGGVTATTTADAGWKPALPVTAMFAGGDDVADDAARLLVPRTVVPQEAIARYTAKRVPPLAETISRKRRELCRDIVTRAAENAQGVREIMKALVEDGFGQSDWHRETIARTETGQLYNHGRVARYRSCGAVAGYRYEAIIDGRETALCRELDGHMFKFDDADGATPPMHYACRSTISPVMWFEAPAEWDDPSAIIGGLDKAEQPMPGFGGVDTSDMPAPETLADFLRPLAEAIPLR